MEQIKEERAQSGDVLRFRIKLECPVKPVFSFSRVSFFCMSQTLGRINLGALQEGAHDCQEVRPKSAQEAHLLCPSISVQCDRGLGSGVPEGSAGFSSGMCKRVFTRKRNAL